MPIQQRETNKLINLFMATKSRWKRQRVIMNPTFSASKLREVIRHLNVFLKYLIDFNKLES
jgi:hypothetical protein